MLDRWDLLCDAVEKHVTFWEGKMKERVNCFGLGVEECLRVPPL